MMKRPCVVVPIALCMIVMAAAYESATEADECRPKLKRVQVEEDCQKGLYRCSNQVPPGEEPVCAYGREKCSNIHKLFPNLCFMNSKQECSRDVFVVVPLYCCEGVALETS